MCSDPGFLIKFVQHQQHSCLPKNVSQFPKQSKAGHTVHI